MEVYEKINKAVIVCSAIQTLRGISHHPPANPASNSSPPITGKTTDIYGKPDSSKHPQSIEGIRLATPRKMEAVNAVSINFDFSSQSGPTEFSIKEGKKLEMQVEDSFTEYINRVKIRMRKTMSNVGDMPMPNIINVSNFSDGEYDSGKDEFSEFIDRAGIKIRTTSRIGGRNSLIFN